MTNSLVTIWPFPEEIKMDRREFIKKSITTATFTAGATAGISAKSYSRVIGANDRIRLGQFMFTEITAVRRVGLVVGIVDFVGDDKFVRNRKLLDYRKGVLTLEIGIARTFAGHGQRAIA